MPRDIIRVTIEDLSQFAKTLRSDLPNPPSHVETLSLIARAAGYRNFQHLREKNTPLPQANDKQVRRALRYFDETGVMVEWPIRRGVRELCVWAIWANLPSRQKFHEREISALIDTYTRFRDAAQIRRTLVDMGLLARESDGSNYQRLHKRPSAEAQVLIQRIAARQKERS
ncbi:DUF2087 domain-containing protein [Epibacterium ulvae]|uniref:DUF2087 domain-containing protein n=1 Tax=Epibacterium ulvae TaxID=1156985 RepID=UPI00249085E5|nr:DUF2087 domain-containing protein [Epibacterium ulvae]